MTTPQTQTASPRATLGLAREFAELVAKSGRTQAAVAAFIARATGRSTRHYHVSRWASGQAAIPAEVMDAIRTIENDTPPPAELAATARDPEPPPAARPPGYTRQTVPLYSESPWGNAHFSAGHEIGAVPAHPAQDYAKDAFAFVQFGDAMAPMISHGATVFAVRGSTPNTGAPCVAELSDGTHFIGIFHSADARSVFLSTQVEPKPRAIPVRDLVSLSAIVGISFA